MALVFGREDIGLTQEQLTRCDILVNIPSNEEYPILNLSHAATIVMYEIFASHGKPSNPKKATEMEKDRMSTSSSTLCSTRSTIQNTARKRPASCSGG